MAVLWFWFPVGPAGIRTLLLFVSALSVFVLRVGQLHLGMADRTPMFQLRTELFTRVSDNSVTLRDFHKISVSLQHTPDIGMVPFLSMVVQRGLHVVSARVGEPGLGSCRKVSKQASAPVLFGAMADE